MKELTDSVYTFADLRQGKYLYVDKLNMSGNWFVRIKVSISCHVPVVSESR